MEKVIAVGTTWTSLPCVIETVVSLFLRNGRSEAVRAVILDSDGTEVEVTVPPGTHRIPVGVSPQAVRASDNLSVALIAHVLPAGHMA